MNIIQIYGQLNSSEMGRSLIFNAEPLILQILTLTQQNNTNCNIYFQQQQIPIMAYFNPMDAELVSLCDLTSQGSKKCLPSYKSKGLIVSLKSQANEQGLWDEFSLFGSKRKDQIDNLPKTDNIFSSVPHHQQFKQSNLFYSDPYKERKMAKNFQRLNDQKSIESFIPKHTCNCSGDYEFNKCQKSCKLCQSNPRESSPNKCYAYCISSKRAKTKAGQNQTISDPNFYEQVTRDITGQPTPQDSGFFEPNTDGPKRKLPTFSDTSSFRHLEKSPKKPKVKNQTPQKRKVTDYRQPYLNQQGVLTRTCTCSRTGCINNYCSCVQNGFRCSSHCNCAQCQNYEGAPQPKIKNAEITTNPKIKLKNKSFSLMSLFGFTCMESEDLQNFCGGKEENIELEMELEPVKFFSISQMNNGDKEGEIVEQE